MVGGGHPWQPQQVNDHSHVVVQWKGFEMVIECTGSAFLYRWPGGEVHLEPGKRYDLPDERAKRLLQKAQGRVRVIHPLVPSATVAWLRADGTRQIGLIDFVHDADDGTRWILVSVEETWAALNVKCIEWLPL